MKAKQSEQGETMLEFFERITGKPFMQSFAEFVVELNKPLPGLKKMPDQGRTHTWTRYKSRRTNA